jgi:hypothetical protein
MEQGQQNCKEVKEYPTVLDMFSKINRLVVRPKMEALLDHFEKTHNISNNKVEDVSANEPAGDGTSTNNK